MVLWSLKKEQRGRKPSRQCAELCSRVVKEIPLISFRYFFQPSLIMLDVRSGHGRHGRPQRGRLSAVRQCGAWLHTALFQPATDGKSLFTYTYAFLGGQFFGFGFLQTISDGSACYTLEEKLEIDALDMRLQFLLLVVEYGHYLCNVYYLSAFDLNICQMLWRFWMMGGWLLISCQLVARENC